MSEPEEKIISVRIFMAEDLKNEFKAVCARQGANMSEVVVNFVKGYVAEYGFGNVPTKPKPALAQDSLAGTTSAEEALFRASRFVDEPGRDNLVPSKDPPAAKAKPATAKIKRAKDSKS